MTSIKVLTIIGITGQQGHSVYRVFKSEPGWRICGITRDTSKWQYLVAPKVELVSANLDDRASLETAFIGSHAIFAVTDLWQHLKDETTFSAAAKQNRQPSSIAMEREVQQGENIVRAAASAECMRTLERLVVSTLSDSEYWSGGEIKWNPHFDGKTKYTAYLKKQFPGLAAKSSYLQMGAYLSNWRMNPRFHPRKQDDGSFVHANQILSSAKHPLPFVVTPHDTGHFVRALILSPPAGSTMMGVSQWMSVEEYCAVWGRLLGVRARHQSLTYEELDEDGMPEWLALEISQSGQYVGTYGWAGGDSEVKDPKDLGVDTGFL